MHGDIYSQPDYGKEIITLDDRAIKVFEKRFPEDTEIYAKKEKTRIYENPINDPLIKKTEKKIKRMTDEHMAQLLKGIWGEEKAKEVNRSKEEARFAIRQWDIFISLYPEKTAGYKNKFEPIREILKRRETKVQQAIRSELRYPKTESHHLKGIVEQVKLRKHDEQQDGQRKEKNPELRHYLKGDKGSSIF